MNCMVVNLRIPTITCWASLIRVIDQTIYWGNHKSDFELYPYVPVDQNCMLPQPGKNGYADWYEFKSKIN